MNLSILCVTNNAYTGTGRFIHAMRELADSLQSEFVLGLDREQAQRAEWRTLADKAIDLTADKLQEDVLDEAVTACGCDWVLRLDDDETASPALKKWLVRGAFLSGRSALYAFPRVYLWPDAQNIIVNDGMYPDLQTRLGTKKYMLGVNHVHAGNPNGTGVVVPYAIEHHKLLVRSREEREEIAARYESLRPGAGSLPQYARYNVPEKFYARLDTKEYSDGDFSAR